MGLGLGLGLKRPTKACGRKGQVEGHRRLGFGRGFGRGFGFGFGLGVGVGLGVRVSCLQDEGKVEDHRRFASGMGLGLRVRLWARLRVRACRMKGRLGTIAG